MTDRKDDWYDGELERPYEFSEEDRSYEHDHNFEAENHEFNEETAVESMPIRPLTVDTHDDVDVTDGDDVNAGVGVGTFALVMSILSLFFLPILLGAAGIIVGFVARRMSARALGNWAIGIGAISIIMTVFFSPFF